MVDPPPTTSRIDRARDSARRRFAAIPLRLRLIAILVALSMLALSVTAVVAVVLLRDQLVNKVDSQVTAVAQGVIGGGPLSGLGNPQDPSSQLPSSQYAVVLLDSGLTVQLGRRLGTASAPDVDGITPAVAAAHDGHPFTVPSTAGDTEWRVVALRVTTTRTGSLGTLIVGQSLRDVDDTVTQLGVVLLVVGLSVLVAIGVAGGFAVRRAFRPLTQVEAVAEAIAAGDLSRRVPDRPTSTEVGRLSASLNAMLAQIEQAFAVREASEERMRRFVSDASHELRTPLATVRGYAELYRQGAVREPDDVAGAMNRIETEATRMGGLVEDLLTLARLDEERTERHTPVDLTVLAGDAVQDARALQPDRPLQILGRGGPLGPVVVSGDENRLRQVVTNLMANALRHTAPGVPVEVVVGREGDQGMVEVRDHGTGIAPEQVERIFERFYRADSSRGRGHGGGSGLGLAIVAAIVNSHQGRVGIAQTSGGGATFVVSLPLAPVPAGPLGSRAGTDRADKPGNGSGASTTWHDSQAPDSTDDPALGPDSRHDSTGFTANSQQ